MERARLHAILGESTVGQHHLENNVASNSERLKTVPAIDSVISLPQTHPEDLLIRNVNRAFHTSTFIMGLLIIIMNIGNNLNV